MRLTIITLLLLVSSLGFGQNYIPFPTNTARWANLSGIDCCPADTTLSTYDLRGDTVFDSLTYKKVYLNNTTYIGALKEDTNNRIYFRYDTVDHDSLLYDFGASIGDTVWFGSHYHYYVIVNEDSILLGDGMHRRVETNHGNWVEGVGDQYYGLLGTHYRSLTTIPEAFSLFLCFHRNDTLIYMNPSYSTCAYVAGISPEEHIRVSIYPNPSSGWFTINTELNNYTIQLYNAQGQAVAFRRNGNSISITNKVPGMYLLSIMQEGQRYTTRLVVE